MKWNKQLVLDEVKKLGKKLKRKPAKRDNSNLYSLSRKYFGTWNNMMKKAGYNVKFKQKINLPKICPEFYYFLGLLSTDGHIQYETKGGKYKIMIFTSKKEEVKMIKRLIKELFNYEASLRTKNYGFSKWENYEIYISSKELADFLSKLGIPPGKKSFSIKVPEIILQDSSENVWHFIRGVFDGDGSILKTRNQVIFKIAMGSENFLKGIKDIFEKKGFDSVKFRKERDTLWDLRINKKKDIERLYALLYKNSKRYFYPRKREKWKTIHLKPTRL